MMKALTPTSFAYRGALTSIFRVADGRQIDHLGGFGDPGAVVDAAVGVIGR